MVVVMGFVVSRVVTDRFGWSQWVWWVPAMWWLVGVWVAWLASWVMGWQSIRRGGRRGKGVAARRVLMMGCLGVSVSVLFGIQRWHRVIGSQAGIQEERTIGQQRVELRVVHWNIAAGDVGVGAFVGMVDRIDADVILIANARWDGQRDVIRGGLVSAVIGETESEEWKGSLSLGRALVVSKFPVSASMVYLGLQNEEGAEGVRATGRFGWVAVMTVHRDQEHGGDVVVWLVDLPSEPTALRRETFGMVVEKVSARLAGTMKAEGVARPGLIIGDFNTPRGSGSIGVFDVFEAGDGFEDAFAQAGFGPGRSWVPAGRNGVERMGIALADWHIDLSLTGNGWSAGGYGLFRSFDGRAFGGSHAVQVVDIARDK